ncbi:MAG: hypothetical protein ORN51_12280 [Akkermansiaceae bacterium]|nr:hypothetical protein [Akkermansiaceae bacterium]
MNRGSHFAVRLKPAIGVAHTDWFRASKALHVLLGIARFPGTDTTRNLFLCFRQDHIEEF